MYKEIKGYSKYMSAKVLGMAKRLRSPDPFFAHVQNRSVSNSQPMPVEEWNEIYENKPPQKSEGQ